MTPKRPVLPADLLRLATVGEIRISPDGRLVAHVETRPAPDGRSYRRSIWLQPADGSAPPRAFTQGERDGGLAWSPDSRRLAFVSDRAGEGPQLHVIDVDGGEARRLTSLPHGVSRPRWSPDGRWIAFLASIAVTEESRREDERIAAAPDRAGARAEAPLTRAVRRLDYRFDGDGYFDGRRDHLHVIPAAGGEARQLTDGDWKLEGHAWSPDSERLVLVGDRRPDADIHLDNQLLVIARESGTITTVPVAGMLFGTVIWGVHDHPVALAQEDPGIPGSIPDLLQLDLNSGKATALTEDVELLDMVISDMRATHGSEPQWDAAGNLWFQVSARGACGVARMRPGSPLELVVSGEREVFEFSVAREGSLALGITTPSEPGDVYVFSQGRERRLTEVNREWQEEVALVAPRTLALSGRDGRELQGWILLPPTAPGVRPPLVLEIHGGPHGAYGHTFFLEFQVLATHGLAVAYVNPRGSATYGEEFTRAVSADWGGEDRHDLMRALDQILVEQEIDGSRLGVAGGSYGGYMTALLLGHTDRFRAAIAMRSVTDLISMTGTTDDPTWMVDEVGEVLTDAEELWRRSPMGHAAQITTPLLLLHGEMDLRCPIGQAEELFSALRRLGREVELIRFPEESHDLSRSGRPDRRVERLRLILEWFSRHLAPAGDPGQTTGHG